MKIGYGDIAGGGPGGATEGCRIYHSVNQNIANAVWTVLTFNSERFDTDGMHEAVINPTRITIATAGKYLIGGNARFETVAAGTLMGLEVLLNGATEIGVAWYRQAWASIFSCVVNTVYDLGVGDYVELRAYQNTGAVRQVFNVPNYSPEFWAHRLS